MDTPAMLTNLPTVRKDDPERALWAAVLELAIADLHQQGTARLQAWFRASVSDWQTPGSRVRIFSAMLSQGIHLDLEGRHGQVWKYWAPFDRDWPAVAGTCAGL